MDNYDSDRDDDDASAGASRKRGAAATSSRPRQRTRTRGPVHYDEWKTANRDISSVFHNASHGLKDALDIFTDFRKTSKIPFEIRLTDTEHDTGFSLTITSGHYQGLELDGSNRWSGLTIVHPEFTAVYTSSGYSMRLSNDIKTIEGYAFRGCRSLASVAFPDALHTIETRAFDGCRSLASVDLSTANVQTIGEYAFAGCSSLASIVFPDALQTIGAYAFFQCVDLASVAATHESSASSAAGGEAGGKAGGKASLGTFGPASLGTFPDALHTIGMGAFWGCSKLASVAFPDALQTIEEEAFYGCKSLASVVFPDALQTIEQYAFYKCSSLASVSTANRGFATRELRSRPSSSAAGGKASLGTEGPASLGTFPDALQTIGEGAFYGCSSLASVAFPDALQTIEGDAFFECSSLASVAFPGCVADHRNACIRWVH